MSHTVLAICTRLATSTPSAELLYSRLTHVGPATLQQVLQNGDIGIQICKPSTCEYAVCAKSKAHYVPRHANENCARPSWKGHYRAVEDAV